MPVPPEYQRLHDEFYDFLLDARDVSGLATTHMTWTMVQGVFQVFRCRVDLADAIRFAVILPAGLRALFTADWEPDEPRRPFDTLAAMTAEVKHLRQAHNFSTETAIADVATALRRHVDAQALERVLKQLPEGSAAFWRGHKDT
jgi:uncharacterized protein (DUF2267 family)